MLRKARHHENVLPPKGSTLFAITCNKSSQIRDINEARLQRGQRDASVVAELLGRLPKTALAEVNLTLKLHELRKRVFLGSHGGITHDNRSCFLNTSAHPKDFE